MITYHNGDLLNSGCQMICHSVNEFGYMGKGIALQFKQKYIQNYHNYKAYCKNKKENTRGSVFYFKENDVIIANCFCQVGYKAHYNLIALVLKSLKDYCLNNDIKTIGIPYKFGCGLAGGDWEIVESMFKECFQNENNINLQIWKYKI